MKTLIADIETNGLLPELETCHCLAVGSLELDDIIVYADQPNYPPLAEGLQRLREADRVVFHNGCGFDYPALRKLYGKDVLDRTKVFDTLLLSRIVEPANRSHALEKWGERLGFPKGDYSDWTKFTDEMAMYCKQDVAVTQRVYKTLMEKIDEKWDEALRLEHDFAWVMSIQEQHGFRLDVDAVQDLDAELRQEMATIEQELQKVFPPITIERVSEKTGKALKSKIEMFNPGSRKQIAERLKDMYNWVPKKFTPAGSPQIDDLVLGALEYPEAKLLARYFRCQKQLSMISEGDSAWLRCVRDGYVHGRVNTIGTATSRCSHFAPNMAQVDKKDKRMRAVWVPDPGHVLVGCDGDALELRMLAAYLHHFDGGKYTHSLLEGKKENGTDVHSMTGKLVGCKDRDQVKRLTYAYLYGAGDLKLTQILREAGATVKTGKEARARMNEGITGLGKLSTLVRSRVKRGYIKGIDGRHVPVVGEHSALNYLLQSAGAILMKKAMQVFHYDLCVNSGFVKDDEPVHFHYCANVHDEVQLSCEPEHAETLGKLFAESIKIAGERLGLKCPTSGSYDIGSSWLETH